MGEDRSRPDNDTQIHRYGDLAEYAVNSQHDDLRGRRFHCAVEGRAFVGSAVHRKYTYGLRHDLRLRSLKFRNLSKVRPPVQLKGPVPAPHTNISLDNRGGTAIYRRQEVSRERRSQLCHQSYSAVKVDRSHVFRSGALFQSSVFALTGGVGGRGRSVMRFSI